MLIELTMELYKRLNRSHEYTRSVLLASTFCRIDTRCRTLAAVTNPTLVSIGHSYNPA